jgi:hypothetical protein
MVAAVAGSVLTVPVETSVLAQLYVTVVYNYCHCAVATVYNLSL